MGLFAKGYNGQLSVDDKFITIARKGAMAKLAQGFTKGEKRIALSSVTSVQFKKSGISVGYIQFSLSGASESRAGVMDANKDENSVTFTKKHQAEFEAVRDYVESQIGNSSLTQSGVSVAEQLEKLANLKGQGLLTEEEFAAQKAKLL